MLVTFAMKELNRNRVIDTVNVIICFHLEIIGFVTKSIVSILNLTALYIVN